MASPTGWGLCLTCKWWQIEPTAPVVKDTIGQCIEESLQRVVLSVTGNSGCNLYSQGEVARAVGSASQPPTAKPSR